jgi:hypothetical protein
MAMAIANSDPKPFLTPKQRALNAEIQCIIPNCFQKNCSFNHKGQNDAKAAKKATKEAADVLRHAKIIACAQKLLGPQANATTDDKAASDDSLLVKIKAETQTQVGNTFFILYIAIGFVLILVKAFHLF